MSYNINNNGSNGVNTGESINLRAELHKYIMHWKWFFLSTIIALILSVLFIKTKSNVYDTKASILVKEDGSVSSELKMFQDLSPMGMGSTNNVYDEIEILKSRTLTRKYAENLNLNIQVYEMNNFKDIELYTKRPIKCQVLSDKQAFYQLDTFIDITILDAYQYKYKIEEDENSNVIKFGEKLQLGKYSFTILPLKVGLNGQSEKKYRIVFNKIEKVVENLKRKVEVNSVDDYSNIIELKLQSNNKSKAQSVLNKMIELYNQMSVDDQNLIALKTDDFISKRLDLIKNELSGLDKLEELYKSEKKITDFTNQSKVFIDNKSVNKQEIFAKEAQLRLVQYLLQELNEKKDDFELLPASIGVTESPQLSVSVNSYNELLFERNRLLRTSSMSNPVVRNLDIELKNSIDNIKQSLVITNNQLEIALKSLNVIESEFEKKITALPKQVREYREILRQQSIVEELYSYLLKKKEENEISMAVTVPKSKIIDKAYSLNNPIAPKKNIILLAGVIIGLIIPLVIIYIKDLFDTKFKTRAELEGIINAPVLGDIPFDTSGEKIVVNKGSRTSTAEAFRLLRTNLDFMLTSIDSSSKSIFVTSTISGEGKTFVAANVAASIALTGKKVLLTGMDLRAPKISQYLGLPNRKGVSNFLVDKNILLDDIVSPLEGFENLYFLSSGVVPPNPAELLLSPRMDEMFTELKKSFDYIVVDTAPVNLVTDTLMISKYADMFLYTVRSNYLEKSLLEVPERLYQEKRLPNMAVLLNGLDYTRGYGYGGYGYPKEDTHKNIFQRIFKK